MRAFKGGAEQAGATPNEEFGLKKAPPLTRTLVDTKVSLTRTSVEHVGCSKKENNANEPELFSFVWLRES